MHTSLLVALATGEYMPAAQGVHGVVAPLDDDHEPAGQF